MFKTKMMTGIMLAVLAFAPAIATAGDVSSSYANKKSGKVVFKTSESSTVTTDADAQATPSNVAEIEPAAGAEATSEADVSVPSKSSSLAESMKLPRK